MIRPAGVPMTVAGRARVPEEEFKRKIGRPAFLVLLILWSRRSPQTGETTVTNAGIGRAKGFERLGIKTVEKAITRLRQAGLVEAVGWQKRVVPEGRTRVTRDVYVRRIFGALADPASLGIGARSVVFVPLETVAWLESANTHGGHRWDGNRPPNPGGDPTLDGGSRVGKGGIKRGDPPGGSRVGSDLTLWDQHKIGVSDLLASLGDTAAVRRTGAGLQEGERIAAMLTVPTRERPAERPAPQASQVTSSDHPTTSCGTRSALVEGGLTKVRPLVLPTTPFPGLPPFPGMSLLGSATVPDPPLLDAALDVHQRAIVLVNTYRRVVENRTKQRCFAFARGVLSQSKHYPLLVKAAEALIEREIPPAAWIAWSIDTAAATAADRGVPFKLPPLTVIFSPKAIRTPRGWFTRIGPNYAGGRVVIGRGQRTLFERYARMRADIDREGAWDDPATIVRRHFPEGYDQAVATVKAEIVATQKHLQERVAAGEVFW